MSEAGYLLKVLIVTAIFVTIMQFKVGNNTLENHAHLWIEKSWVGEKVAEVTEGGWKLLRDGYKKVNYVVGRNFDKENMPGERKLGEMKRSVEHLKDEAKKKGVDVDELAAAAEGEE